MSITYDVRVVALTIGETVKWVDNLLSHHAIPGVVQGRQGVERRITKDGLLAIEIVRLLAVELNASLASATAIATAMLDSRTGSQLWFRTESGITLEIAAAELERRLHHGVADAIESIPRVRRGRPALRSRDAE